LPAPSLGTTAPDIVPTASVPEQSGGFAWWWVLGAALLVGLAGAAAWWKWRGAGSTSSQVAVPRIERPRVVAQPVPAPAPVPPVPPAPAPAAEPLHLALEPLRLSLTLMNASLSYRLEVSNRGPNAIDALRIEADMISAHASLPRDQQLSGPGQGAPTAHVIEHLAPGESRLVEGEFRLPFPQIVPIRQGTATLLLPLARFRAQAAGSQPVVRTFAVGQPGGAGMQPFRLDQGPRVFPQLVQRAFG